MTAADKARVAGFRTESDQWLDGLLREAITKERQRIRRAIAVSLRELRSGCYDFSKWLATARAIKTIDRATRAPKGKRK